MAQDLKYGEVTTEYGTLGDDELVVVFRARDYTLPNVLKFYREQCKLNGSSQHHLDLIEKSLIAIEDWQTVNADLVRIPNSDSHKERIGKL